ncbi:MAG: hypothetical protein WD404_05095 [Solirubrobacterales bacterium]
MAKSKKRKRRRKRGGRRGPQQPAPRKRLTPEEREIEQALAAAERRAREALSPDTPPKRVAELLVEEFDDLPSPVGLALTLQGHGSDERARAVASEAQRLARGSVTVLTFAAEVARAVDGDAKGAAALLDDALDAYVDPSGVVALAQHLAEAGRLLDSLTLAEEHLCEEPGDEDAETVRARALEELHERSLSGGGLAKAEEAALERFCDRGLLYRLREGLGEFVEGRPELQEAIAAAVRSWLDELEEDEDVSLEGLMDVETESDRLAERRDGIARLAIEHAWLLDDGDEEVEPEPETEESDAPLALLAGDSGTERALAQAARDWLGTCSYGLWQLAHPEPAPGVWLTDLVSGARRYAAIPPEQLEGAGRWSVLLGSLVALDGTWRTTGAVLPMRPSEGDRAAELAREATTEIARALTGKRPRKRTDGRKQPPPHGVLTELDDPAPSLVADLMGKVVGSMLPAIAGELWEQRSAGPTLTNMDGHRLRLITALVDVKDGATARERLAAHEDFRTEEDGELSWWGRELTEMERQTGLAQLRSQLGPESDEEIEEPEETPRWLRGRLAPREGGFEVDVNSEERLDALLGLLRELGLEPELGRRSTIDPAQDMPRLEAGGPIPFGASQEAIDAWLAHWPTERVPALGGLTPEAAAKREQQRPALEALLREFEHDAHVLTEQGRPAPDLGHLRAELGMERWWECR